MKDLHNIDIVILCGGLGTRLKEETELKPKPMVEIGDRPILWHIMKYYSCFGFRRFILALGYKADYIKQYFYKSDWEIVCIDTGLHTQKGGRIKRIEPYLQGDIFHLTYGDGLCNLDLMALHSFHLQHGKVGTVTAVRPPSRFGEMVIENDQVVTFEEKPQLSTGYINGGFFVFNRSFLSLLTSDEKCDLEFGALQTLSRDRELNAYKHNGYWQCMDNIRDRDFLNSQWIEGCAPWKIWVQK